MRVGGPHPALVRCGCSAGAPVPQDSAPGRLPGAPGIPPQAWLRVRACGRRNALTVFGRPVQTAELSAPGPRPQPVSHPSASGAALSQACSVTLVHARLPLCALHPASRSPDGLTLLRSRRRDTGCCERVSSASRIWLTPTAENAVLASVWRGRFRRFRGEIALRLLGALPGCSWLVWRMWSRLSRKIPPRLAGWPGCCVSALPSPLTAHLCARSPLSPTARRHGRRRPWGVSVPAGAALVAAHEAGCDLFHVLALLGCRVL